jgi:hypothetical protein
VQVNGLMKQIKARGLAPKLLAAVSPATRTAFEDPWSAKWHSGEVLVEFSEALVAELGQQGFEALNYDMTKASFGPILGPMVQVALAITGRSPATLFARVPAAIEQALKNVKCVWTSTGATSGELRFEYPCAIKPDTEYAWRGALRFVSELCGNTNPIERCDVKSNGLCFYMRW